MLHGWDGVLGIVLTFFLQTRRVEFIAKSYILVSSDHMTFSHASSSRWSLANFRRAWTCAGLSRGTLRLKSCTLQDFNPWRCSVLLMVTVETVVPALFRSLTRSSCVVLGWSLIFLRIIDTSRRDLAWSPSPREIDSHLEFLSFSNNCANSCCLLTKLFAYCPVADPSLVQVYNVVPSVLRQLFGLAHSGEVGVWLIEYLPMMKLQISPFFVSGKTWKIGNVSNTYLPHCIVVNLMYYEWTQVPWNQWHQWLTSKTLSDKEWWVEKWTSQRNWKKKQDKHRHSTTWLNWFPTVACENIHTQRNKPDNKTR